MHMHVLHEVYGRASLTTATAYVQAKREAVELATLEWVPCSTTTACRSRSTIHRRQKPK